MKELLSFLVENILGKNDFTIEEEGDNSRKTFHILCNPDDAGLIIGKGGNTIKAIQNILRVKARLENTSVFVNVSDKTE